MKINILLPYKEKFDEKKAASVSITVRNNLLHSNYLNQIKIFGQNVKNPFFKDNFVGLKYSILSLKSKNKFLAHEMLKIIAKDSDKNQLIEIHNRPYLVDKIIKGNKFPISFFFHNNPQSMNGSKSIKDRENILHKCVAVFCVSEFIKKKFLEGIKENFEKVHVLYNGVERKLLKFPKKKKEVLFVGRLVPEKGVHIYVEAVKAIAHKHPEWSFGLIGSFKLGDNKNRNLYSDTIIKKIRSVGHQAQFYGFQDQKFVEEKMKSASIVIIPSIWEEPFGLVAAEAMSNGACIIASKVGGIPEVIKDNGILIDNINYKKLSLNIQSLIEDNKMRLNYQRRAWKNFELSSNASSKKLDSFRKTICADYF
ncbi:glycosyltransferase family 4 protein [Alphaproteobacteria bacterium]|nr:glycosyltransferase family 4 protein [Alphaproteobacteria bacterium]